MLINHLVSIRINESGNRKAKIFFLKMADIQRLQPHFERKRGSDKKVIQNLAINSKILFLHP